MPSYETYAKIFNNTAGHIKLKVSEVDSHDWDGHYRPDMNLNGKTMTPNSELREREEINRFSTSNMYRLTIEFSDTESMSARIDQRKARDGFYTVTDYYLAPNTRKYYALKIRRIVDNGKDTLNIKIFQRGVLPKTRVEFHAGVVAALVPVSPADHTYVFTHDGKQEINFPCWGSTRRDISKISGYGDLELAIAIACFDPFDRRSNYDDYACTFPSKGWFFGDCSGIRYGITGMCHQMSNRIMYAMDSHPTVSFARWSEVTYLAYGVYGEGIGEIPPLPAYLAECQNRVNIGRNPKGDVKLVTAEQVKEELLRRAENMDAFSRESIRLDIEHEGDKNLPDLRLKLLIDTAFPQGYDSGKIKEMTEKDAALRARTPEPPLASESEVLTKQNMLDYADKVNRLFADRLTSIHSIVGGEDFKKIFGVEYCADFALIDKQMIKAAEC